jgi:hypothetical protein
MSAAVIGTTTIIAPQTRLSKKFAREGVMSPMCLAYNKLFFIILTVCHTIEKQIDQFRLMNL